LLLFFKKEAPKARKRKKLFFFSEEKKQKTFTYGALFHGGAIRGRMRESYAAGGDRVAAADDADSGSHVRSQMAAGDDADAAG
jgi:hypothetical protein